MTLVLSCGVRDAVLQVSDRLLTMPDGSVYNAAANKAICVWCLDAHVAIAYSGLAIIGKKQADHWLVDTLVALSPATLTLEALGIALSKRLSAAFRMQTHYSNRYFTLVVSGYRDNLPFFGCVSNHMAPDGTDLPAPALEFALLKHPLDGAAWRRAIIAVSGELRALPKFLDKRIKNNGSSGNRVGDFEAF